MSYLTHIAIARYLGSPKACKTLDTVAYCEQPFTITYDRQNIRKKYTPDFLIERRCSKQVIEVKPKSQVESFITSDRFLF